jgi:hypothetical protein
MDTHRRSSGAVAAAAAGTGGVAADSAAAIYSGLELARLAAGAGQQQADNGDVERHAAVFPKPIGTYRLSF